MTEKKGVNMCSCSEETRWVGCSMYVVFSCTFGIPHCQSIYCALRGEDRWVRGVEARPKCHNEPPPPPRVINNTLQRTFVDITPSPTITMSDSEEDFMSDKFLVDAPSASEQTYSSRRAAAQRRSAAKVAAHTAQQRPLREIEAERRKAGLARNLLADSDDDEEDEGRKKLAVKPTRTQGQNKAMGLMKAMGWTPGEALGRRRSASPPSKPTAPSDPSSSTSGHAGIGARGRAERAEPIRISMWAGRRGLAARTPSPPPLNKRKESNLESLAADVEKFRGRRGAEEEQRSNERKAHKARELLVEYDKEKGVVVSVPPAPPRS